MENLMLRISRVKMGLNEKGIAQMVHITKEEYMNIENNLVEPRLKDMVNISNVLGTSIEELFNWENPSVCISVCNMVQEGGFEPPQALTL
jgi:DNA-binding XRE family transcriptional regulator